ncbi:hypothetical protein [Pseudomonas sp. HS6]|uniref:hypothetical protein n=1 Tax=Pseudomonas sp. HS6 TaxID=2850559 RepID=UPI0020197CB9|nr:hypothetical protein [Pseudomonas sp. HS6]
MGYTDSTVGVTVNLKTGVNSGIAKGDTFTDIEGIRGSNFNDTFVALPTPPVMMLSPALPVPVKLPVPV